MSRVADARRASQPTPYDGVRFGLGLLLLVAAGLKGHQLATGPVLGAGLLHSRGRLFRVAMLAALFRLRVLAGTWLKAAWAAPVCVSPRRSAKASPARRRSIALAGWPMLRGGPRPFPFLHLMKGEGSREG